MSYIYCSYDNHYKSSESLQGLFKDLVVQPLEHDLPEIADDFREVRIQKLDHQREVVLKQGRASFDVPSEGFSAKDKVSIYCAHYMPMHLFSSYHVFRHNLTPIRDKIVFIDFGCGPLTSGVAFWAFAGQSNIVYLGIDSAPAMLDKAKAINQYGPNKYENPFFGKFRLISAYDYLDRLLDLYIVKGDRTQIIFNFCYFLASPTLDINNLSDVLIQIVEKYNQHKIYVVCQNPDPQLLPESLRSELHGKWEILKTNLLKGQGPKFRLSIQNPPKFKYNRLINRRIHFNVSAYNEILSNESSDPMI